MVYSLLHTVIYPGSRRNRVHVYACACVRVRAIPGPGSRPTYDIELHRGQAAKNFSLCPSPLLFPPSKESLEKEEERGGRKSLEFGVSFFRAIREIRRGF